LHRRESPAKPSPTADPASLAQGRYEIRRLVGEGAKKRVYLAYDRRADRDVAIAFLKTEPFDESRLRRVREEAEAMNRLGGHRRIVAVYDIGEEDGASYIVAEYMGGGTVEQLIAETPERRLPLEQAVRIADQVCEALGHAHAHGFIHRDLKPANVWLTQDGFAKLGDFGLAISIDRSAETAARLAGTLAYASPEQVLGKSVDERSDLYALGCMLYEMLTGRTPFVGKDAAAVMTGHVSTVPDPPSKIHAAIPATLDGLVCKLLLKAPRDRPASAAEVRQALSKVVSAPASPANPLDFAASGGFIGRSAEIERLVERFEEAFAGKGRVVLVAGDPGIGKTRTAEEISTMALRRGARVCVGRCHEGGGAPPFWPWVQVLRTLIDDPRMRGVIEAMGARAADVAQLAPELRERFPDLPATAPTEDLEGARFRLFDCLTSFFKSASRIEPLVLVLDDLHWADKSSLLLLQFLAREIADSRLLAIGTYRDVEAQQGHPLVEILPTMREPVTTKILLRGLPEQEVRLFIGAVSGQEVPAAFARAIFRETEGNPFFIQEMLRHLIEEGILVRESGGWRSRLEPEEMGLPESVREVIRRRFSRLGDRSRDALVQAAVIGREFDARVLEGVSDFGGDELLDVLDEAVAARVIAEVPRAARRFSFSHALIREALIAELGTTRRVQLHRKVAAVLEAVYKRDLEAHLAELAHHFFEGSPGGDVDKAIDYSTRAGDRATSQFAFEEAVVHFQHALRALDHRPTATDSERCELTIKLGEALWSAAEFATSKQAFLRATELAEHAEQKARAALGFAGPYAAFNTGALDETLVGVLERALAVLPEEDSGLRARLMGRLAEMFTFTPRNAAVRPLAREAIAMARRIGDQAALAHALCSFHWVNWSPDNLAERRRSTEEILALSLDIGDSQFEAMAHLWQITELLSLGDVAATTASFAALERCARTTPQPYLVWLAAMSRPLRPFLEGRLDEAEQLGLQAVAIGQERENNNAAQLFGAQLIFFRREQGRLEELVDAVRDLTQRFPTTSSWHCALAWVCTQTGRDAEARDVVERLGRAGFTDFPRDFLWVISTWWIAEAIADLDDAEHAAPLYEQMRPFAGCWMTISTAICAGSVSRSLGRLATTLRRFEDAERHFEEALASHERMGAKLWSARTCFEYAAMLRRRGAAVDRPRAETLLRQALDGAQSFGMKALLEKALALKLEVEGLSGADPRSSIDAITASLEGKPPDLAARATLDGTVTLMFSDMEGFSAMTERLGDASAHAVMTIHNDIIRERVRAHGGFEVEFLGDGFFIAFPSASRALQSAVEIQKAFRRHSERTPERPIRVRMGLHTGEPIREGDNFFGKTVILAARIAARARGGEILVSSLLHQAVDPGNTFAFGSARELALKGLAGTHRVYPVDWESRPSSA
jgi:eukaryotic-like serine/threonine-protein kinase